MSKFLQLIEQMTPKTTSYSDDEVEMMRRSKKKVESGESQDSVDQTLAKKYDDLQNKKKELVKKASQITEAEDDNINPRENEEDRGEGLDQTPNPEEPEEVVTKLSSSGEVFYVDLAKKALYVDMDNLTLPDGFNELIFSDVTPENAKEIATVIRKIVDDAGLSS